MLTLEHLAALLDEHRALAAAKVAEFAIGGRDFRFNAEPSIMGVINLSPDSWYRESVCLTLDQALCRARILTAQGAQIIDVGAESTLAHAARVDPVGATQKLLPVIRGMSSEKILVSVETYEFEVARACLEAGAAVVNLTGNPTDGEIFRLVSAHDAAIILCYVQGANPREIGDFNFAADMTASMRDQFARLAERAQKCGVSKIILDPGLGFYYKNLLDSAQRIRHQMNIFLNTFRLRALGFPVCHALPHAFECFGEDVRSAEPFFAVLAALGKTDLFRTHEVARTRAVLDTLKLYI